MESDVTDKRLAIFQESNKIMEVPLLMDVGSPLPPPAPLELCSGDRYGITGGCFPPVWIRKKGGGAMQMVVKEAPTIAYCSPVPQKGGIVGVKLIKKPVAVSDV